jgi:hypothetical protein
MNTVRTLVKVVYFVLRTIFFPFILILRPLVPNTQFIVATFTLSMCMFIVPIAKAQLGAGIAVAVLGVGTLLACSFLVWGKEFEGRRVR